MLRLKKAIVEFAFLEMLLTCLLQERLLLMVTPRYFESVFVASFWPWIAVLKRVFLVTYSQDFTFFGVEGHLPLLFPLLEPIKILLEFYAVPFGAYFPVE